MLLLERSEFLVAELLQRPGQRQFQLRLLFQIPALSLADDPDDQKTKGGQSDKRYEEGDDDREGQAVGRNGLCEYLLALKGKTSMRTACRRRWCAVERKWLGQPIAGRTSAEVCLQLVWLGYQDSNLDSWYQKPESCRWTIPQSEHMRRRRSRDVKSDGMQGRSGGP